MNNLILPHQARSLSDAEFIHYLGLGLIAAPDHQRCARIAQAGSSLIEGEIEDLKCDLAGAEKEIEELQQELERANATIAEKICDIGDLHDRLADRG